MEQLVARQAHNLEVACSSPASATTKDVMYCLHYVFLFMPFLYKTKISAPQKVTKHLYNLNEAHKLSQAQAQTRVYSYNYTFLFEFVFKLASIAVRQYG